MNVVLASLAAATVAFVLTLVPSAAASRRGLKRRVVAHVEPRRATVAGRPGFRGRLARPLAATETRLGDTRMWRALDVLVNASGIGLKTSEVFYLAFASLLAIVLFATAAGLPPLASIMLAVVATVAARLAFAVRVSRRLQAFEDQLPDILGGLAGALRAGHSFTQALQAVAGDAPQPAGPELERVLAEVRLGRPIDDALAGLGRRTQSKELDFVLTATTIQRQVGGSLAGLFETVADTVRQRQQFNRKLRGLTAMGRASAAVLMAVPIGLAVLLTLMNSAYMHPLFTTATGEAMLVGAAVWMLIGALWLKRIVGIKG